MNKFKLLVVPAITLSLLASCGSSKPTEDITHKFTFTGEHCTINGEYIFSHDILSKDKNVEYTIVPDNEYKLPNTIGSEDVTYDKNTGVITISEINKNIELNVTAIPNPTGKTYTVSYSAGGGKVTSANPDVVVANKPITPPTLADRPEYDESKVKWLDEDGNEFGFEDGTNDNIVLFADWGNKIPVAVHFVETSTKTVDKEIGYGEQAVYYTPTQQGFTFTGWYEEDPETKPTAEEFDFNDEITSDTWIFAGWKAPATKKCNVKFDVTDCFITYKGNLVSEDGITLDVPTNLDPCYIKFVVKGNDDVFMKPSSLLINSGDYTDYYFYNKTGELFINLQQNVVVTGSCDMYKSLDECSWAQIATISESGMAMEAFNIGDEKQIKLIENGQEQPFSHTVRIIGFNHDNLSDGSGTAGITFEFKNLISDNEGYSLATVWNWESGESSTSTNYLDSNLRKAIDGGGEGELSWYRKGKSESEQKDPNSPYKDKTILDMLPSNSDPNNPGLKEVLKEVKKPIALGESYEVKETYITTLFPLSYREITQDSHLSAEEEGSTYAFYQGSGNTDDNRIKHQIKWHDGAATNYTPITDGKCSAKNYAGMNPSTDKNGGHSWLRSPSTNYSDRAWRVGYDGRLLSYTVYYDAFAVAPAFCI